MKIFFAIPTRVIELVHICIFVPSFFFLVSMLFVCRTSIPESSVVGTTVIAVTATDQDDASTNNNGAITYSISGTLSEDNMFH